MTVQELNYMVRMTNALESIQRMTYKMLEILTQIQEQSQTTKA